MNSYEFIDAFFDLISELSPNQNQKLLQIMLYLNRNKVKRDLKLYHKQKAKQNTTTPL